MMIMIMIMIMIIKMIMIMIIANALREYPTAESRMQIRLMAQTMAIYGLLKI